MTLRIDSLSLRFGGVKAVDEVSFEVKEGEIVALIGPNGAGKTSLINCIAGFYTPDGGSVEWRGNRITGSPPHDILRLGIGRTFQNVALLRDLKVFDVVKLGSGRSGTIHPLFSLMGLPSARRFERARENELGEQVLRPLGLMEHADQPIQTLSYGMRKVVDLARAMASSPSMLLLDEPVAGMSSTEARAMAEVIRWVRRERRCGVLMVEHKMDTVMGISDRIVVMAAGCKIFEGSPAEVQVHPEVRRIYLGNVR